LAKVRLDYYLLFNAGRLKALFFSGLRPDELLLLSFQLSIGRTNQHFGAFSIIYNFQVFDVYRARLMSIFPLWMKSKFRRPQIMSCSNRSNDGHKGIVWTGWRPAGQGNNAGVPLERIGPFTTKLGIPRCC
jgi:hypothetical protein